MYVHTLNFYYTNIIEEAIYRYPTILQRHVQKSNSELY